MDNIVNPHDRLFREVGSDKAFAADILRNYLQMCGDLPVFQGTCCLSVPLLRRFDYSHE